MTRILDPNKRPDFRQLHQKLTALLKDAVADDDSEVSVSDTQGQYQELASPTYSNTPNEVEN
jgi:hypothetical protein